MISIRWRNSRILNVSEEERIVTLTRESQSSISTVAEFAGAALAENSDFPLTLLLVLAFLTLRNEIPTEWQLIQLRDIATHQGIPMVPSLESAPLSAVRQGVKDQFTGRGEGILFPDGHWNLARTLLVYGENAWALQDEDASHWGSVPLSNAYSQDAPAQNRILLSQIAGVMISSSIEKRLAIPPSKQAKSSELWMDWIPLAAGPSTPASVLLEDGLGAGGDSKMETNQDPFYQGIWQGRFQLLTDLGEQLLAEADRPVPRYLGRVFTVELPYFLLPELQGWEVDHFLIQVEATGLYVAAQNMAGRSMAATWWKATPESGKRVPISFPPAAYLLTHVILCGIWHDLCSEGIILGLPQQERVSSPEKRKTKESHPRQKSQKKISLPDTRSIALPVERASWGTEPDREAIRDATKNRYGYRLLPANWEGRKEKKDFLLRRQRAAARALAVKQLPPPPGYTFVVRDQMLLQGDEGTSSVETVLRARGLFSLALALQHQEPRSLTPNEAESL